MRRLVGIWLLVTAMVMGGALPPQLVGENEVTMQWCAQAKSKKKSKKKKNNKSRKSRESRVSRKSKANIASKPAASPLVSVPTIGKTSTFVPQQNTNALLGVTIPKGVSNQVLNYQTIRVNYNPSLRFPTAWPMN